MKVIAGDMNSRLQSKYKILLDIIFDFFESSVLKNLFAAAQYQPFVQCDE